MTADNFIVLKVFRVQVYQILTSKHFKTVCVTFIYLLHFWDQELIRNGFEMFLARLICIGC